MSGSFIQGKRASRPARVQSEVSPAHRHHLGIARTRFRPPQPVANRRLRLVRRLRYSR